MAFAPHPLPGDSSDSESIKLSDQDIYRIQNQLLRRLNPGDLRTISLFASATGEGIASTLTCSYTLLNDDITEVEDLATEIAHRANEVAALADELEHRFQAVGESLNRTHAVIQSMALPRLTLFHRIAMGLSWLHRMLIRLTPKWQ